MRQKYYLLLWPESQAFVDHPEYIPASSNEDDVLDGAGFIPVDVYNEK